MELQTDLTTPAATQHLCQRRDRLHVVTRDEPAADLDLSVPDSTPDSLSCRQGGRRGRDRVGRAPGAALAPARRRHLSQSTVIFLAM